MEKRCKKFGTAEQWKMKRKNPREKKTLKSQSSETAAAPAKTTRIITTIRTITLQMYIYGMPEHWAWAVFKAKTTDMRLLGDAKEKSVCECKYGKGIHCDCMMLMLMVVKMHIHKFTNTKQQQRQQQQQSPIITTSNPLNKLSLGDSSPNDTEAQKKRARTKRN